MIDDVHYVTPVIGIVVWIVIRQIDPHHYCNAPAVKLKHLEIRVSQVTVAPSMRWLNKMSEQNVSPYVNASTWQGSTDDKNL